MLEEARRHGREMTKSRQDRCLVRRDSASDDTFRQDRVVLIKGLFELRVDLIRYGIEMAHVETRAISAVEPFRSGFFGRTFT